MTGGSGLSSDIKIGNEKNALLCRSGQVVFSGIYLPFLHDFNFEMLKIERVAAFPCILNP